MQRSPLSGPRRIVGRCGALVLLLGCADGPSSASTEPAPNEPAPNEPAPNEPAPNEPATNGPAEAGGAKAGGAPMGSAPTGSPSVPAPALGATTEAAGPAAIVAPEGMVRIPEGVFLMGSPTGGNHEERPMHEVAIAAFWLDRSEVTMRAYATCVNAGGCTAPKENNPFCNARFSDRDAHPVNCVDWNQAVAYCAFASKRLPTEREWEYAARGGAERRSFSWGEEDADPTRACYMHPNGSCPVGSFAPGAFDLLDMNGNVWEWTSSWFGSYPDELTSGRDKVYRGGSWSRRFPKWLRNELRNRYKVGEHSASLGIRCAKTIDPLVCPAQTSPQSSPLGGLCVRTEGVPGCEAGFAWNGKTCGPAGLTAAAGTSLPVAGPARPAEQASQEAEPTAATHSRSRTPQHDVDCQRNWPATPAAYRWDGGTFHSRNTPIAAAGCQKRDMGRTWTSACCTR